MNAKTASERFWGHVGLEFSGAPVKKWAPISQAEASRLDEVLSSGCRPSGWLAVKALNNRMLLLNPTQWECLSLLDDADEWPAGESVPDEGLNDYAGMPIELYRRMAEWADGNYDTSCNSPAATTEEMLVAINRGGFLERREELRAFLRHTVIHYVSGKTKCYEADRADLCKLIEIEGDVDAGMVRISEGESAEHFYALDKLRMIEIPIIELDAAMDDLAGDLE